MISEIRHIARFIECHPLTRNHKVAAFARVVRWQIRSRLNSEVIVPWIGQTKLAVRRGMTGATGNIYTGLHEFRDMAFVLHFLRHDDLFVDVGSNIGSYTILASGVCRARSISFEPDSNTFSAFLRNISLNNLEASVVAHNKAVGAAHGIAHLTIGLDTINHIVHDPNGATQAVVMDTLDRMLCGERPSLIKLDVEGFEFDVLRGAKSILLCPALQAVLTEDHSPPVREILHAAGFIEWSYDPFTRSLLPYDSKEGGNTLFLRDRELVQQKLNQTPPFRVLHALL